jgi:hypothetical protein
VGEAELLAERLSRRIQIDADDLGRSGQAGALHDVEPDTAEPEHDDPRPGSTFAVKITAPMPVVTPQPT